MTDVTVLEALQKFLKENVTPQVKLKQLDSTNTANYILVTPEVYIGWIPPSGGLPEEQKSDIPCLTVGFDNAIDTGEEALMDIRILFAVFNPGFQDGSTLTVNFDGYKDLLNLMELTKHELRKKRIIEGITTLQYPFKWGVYKNKPCPYWYGWLTFNARTNSGQYIPEINEQYL